MDLVDNTERKTRSHSNSDSSRPDLLAIGHVAKDLGPRGYTLGGTVTYAAATATGLGLSTAIVTSCGADLDPVTALPGVNVHVKSAARTTTFTNVYDRGARSQRVSHVAEPIKLSDVPPAWRRVPLVLLGPLVGEISQGLVAGFRDSLVVGSLQGWLRSLDSEGRVSAGRWDAGEVLPFLDAAVVSSEDAADDGQIDRWKEMVPVLIVTLGRDGSRVHSGGRWHEVDAYAVEVERDPTGAGDVFAAAYLIRYATTRDPIESARFASSAASFSVEGVGVDSVPTLAQVEDRLMVARRCR